MVIILNHDKDPGRMPIKQAVSWEGKRAFFVAHMSLYKGTISKGKFIKLKLPQFSGGYSLVFRSLSHKFPKILISPPLIIDAAPADSQRGAFHPFPPTQIGGFSSPTRGETHPAFSKKKTSPPWWFAGWFGRRFQRRRNLNGPPPSFWLSQNQRQPCF